MLFQELIQIFSLVLLGGRKFSSHSLYIVVLCVNDSFALPVLLPPEDYEYLPDAYPQAFLDHLF